MQLSAQQRYATLKVMGTHLWVPRVHLPGAAASSVCAWPAAVKPPSARERLFQQNPAPVAQVAPSQPPPAVAAPAPLVEIPITPPAPVKTQPLYADVWLLANGWQLVMENLTGQQGLQEGEIKLLHNLLFALFPGGLGLTDQQFFSWPLPGIAVSAGDEGELTMTLQAFLTGARFQKVQLAGCLVFGERLVNLMNKTKTPIRLFSAPSLNELQQSTAAKQQFWQQAGSSGLRAAFASSPVTF